MISKRIFDLICTIPGILVLSPIFIGIAIWIKLDSAGEIFFRQERVGRLGVPFQIYKFRTMITNAEKMGTQITIGADQRITNSGYFLRKYKLDELPQLLNVVLGEMSLVGPRPEVPKYVAQYPDKIRSIVLSVPPGITDFASIEYKDESTILGMSDNPEQDYIQKVLPVKLDFCVKYVRERNLLLDCKLILLTIKAIFVK